ncbi:unnamed protein product [Leptidea sinapis]|uniref:Uncharacterized protein n=1 Tax=Leptidea sinapis TaxID=189913 RepID=A0A5E4PST9_9NEOP|nr:unnamed protein product [Leptidea sinapis]
MHYRGFDSLISKSEYSKVDCNLVKVDTYRFVARLHSVTTKELICVGAVLSSSSVLANELCIRSALSVKKDFLLMLLT